MSTIVLNCWILGEAHTRFFPVELDATKNVAYLKDAIIWKKRNAFQYIDADDLELWKVSIPFDDRFHESLNNLNVDDKEPMLPSMSLSSAQFAADQHGEKYLHIVIRAPPAYHRRQLFFRLNCLVLNDEGAGIMDDIFSVDINESVKTVADLKQCIKDEIKPEFDHVAANALDLWKVSESLVVDRNFRGNEIDIPALDEDSRLVPLDNIRRVFSEVPDPERLHVVVKGPYNPQSIGTLRAQFLQASSSSSSSSSSKAAPSSSSSSHAADPQEFLKRQENPNKMVYCDRPPFAFGSVPVTLLHPVFGQFIDDCDNYEPTEEDGAFVLTLLHALATIYPNEEERVTKILETFESYGLSFVRTKTGTTDYATDGDISYGDFRFALIEVKDEVGYTGTEPFFQSILYYLESTRRQAPEMPTSVLPCMIINIFGPYMSVAGAAWHLRPAAEILTTALPFQFNLSNEKLKVTAARYLGALKNAIRSLQDYYSNEFPVASITPSNSPLCGTTMFPYRKHFVSLADSITVQHFEYVTEHEHNRLLFFGKLSSDGSDICIKFTHRYSKEVHTFCASKGFAPKLLGCEMIPGEWWMVVMERIDESHVELHESSPRNNPLVLENLKRLLTCLHGEGLVHGDVRDTNIMVRRSGGGGDHFLLVDFDWAGRIGEVRYPMNVHRGKDLWRPDGVRDGQLILAEHDDDMLEYMYV